MFFRQRFQRRVVRHAEGNDIRFLRRPGSGDNLIIHRFPLNLSPAAAEQGRQTQPDQHTAFFQGKHLQERMFQMTFAQRLLCCYLLLINALGLALMYLDKRFAKKHRRRIPEAALMWIAALGGSPAVCRNVPVSP